MANDITMKELFITNPYHNMRIVPGDKMVVIGEIFDMDLKKKFGGLLGATTAMINREFKNEFVEVDKKAALRKICMDNIALRLGGIDKDALDAKIKRKNVKIKKTKAIISRMKKLGRRKRRYKKLQEAKLAAEQVQSDRSKPFGISVEPVEDIGQFEFEGSEKWRSPMGGTLENSQAKNSDEFDQKSQTMVPGNQAKVNPMIDRYAMDDTPVEGGNINVEGGDDKVDLGQKQPTQDNNV